MPSQWIPVSLSPKNYQFVSLEQPDGKGPDISFVESSCCNSEWDASRKDGKAMVYFPTMSADGQLCIRAFDVSAEKPTTSIVMTVSLGNDSSSMLSCYGSKLSAQGIMWMCMFSANKVIGVDLATKKMSHEFSGIPCPNDLCLDSKDSNSIYVAAGLGITACSDGHCPGDKLVAALPFVGRVYLIDIAKRKSGVFLESSDFRALAGICASQGSLFISQLFETRAVTLAAAAAGGKSTKTAAVWEGNEVGDGASYFLADNISTWDDEAVCVALYRRVSAAQAAALRSRTAVATGWSLLRCLTCAVCRDGGLANAELPLALSKQDSYTDCTWLLYDTKSQHKYHYRLAVDALQGAAGPGLPFDGHCTHVQRHAGRVVFVNFRSDRVLVVPLAALPPLPGREVAAEAGGAPPEPAAGGLYPKVA